MDKDALTRLLEYAKSEHSEETRALQAIKCANCEEAIRFDQYRKDHDKKRFIRFLIYVVGTCVGALLIGYALTFR